MRPKASRRRSESTSGKASRVAAGVAGAQEVARLEIVRLGAAQIQGRRARVARFDQHHRLRRAQARRLDSPGSVQLRRACEPREPRRSRARSESWRNCLTTTSTVPRGAGQSTT